MVDLGTLANVATALTLFAALVFGVIQLRQFERNRREAAALALVHSFQNASFLSAVRVVWHLEDGARARDITADPALEDAAAIVGATWNTVAYMVESGLISDEIADELIRPYVVTSWRKLERYAAVVRKASNDPATWAGFERLAKRFEPRVGATEP